MIPWLAFQASGAEPAPATLVDGPKVLALGPEALKARLFAPAIPPTATRIVNFWATWCGPCVAEIPTLVAYAKAHPEVEVVMVDLDLPKLRQSHVVPFLKDHAPDHIVHLQLDDADPAKAISQVVPDFPNTVPITLVVDAHGVVTKRIYRALAAEDLPR